MENVHYQHAEFDPNAAPEELLAPAAGGNTDNVDDMSVSMGVKVGRNDPCPCGSGKKYKACHGKLA